MTAEYRTTVARWGLLLFILVGCVAGMMGTFGGLTLVAEGWPEVALMAVIIVFMVVWLGGMVLAMRRFAQYDTVYTASADGLREEARPRGRERRVREIAWDEVVTFTSGRGVMTGLGYLRLRTRQGQWKITATGEEKRIEEFQRFREAVESHLQALAVPARGESRLARLSRRGFGLFLAGMVVAFPVYAFSLPAAERPEMWGLRWLILFGLSLPIILRTLGGDRAAG